MPLFLHFLLLLGFFLHISLSSRREADGLGKKPLGLPAQGMFMCCCMVYLAQLIPYRTCFLFGWYRQETMLWRYRHHDRRLTPNALELAPFFTPVDLRTKPRTGDTP